MKKRVIKRYHRVFFVGLLMLNQLSAMERPRFDVDTIREQLPSYTKVAEGALGRDITVFIGNTGVGKSTLIDAAAGFPLHIDSGGRIALDGEVKGAAPVAPGGASITQCPQYFHSPKLGDMYDLPGFLDTRGTIGNILNASAIQAVLTKARTVRVIFVTSEAELTAARGPLSRMLDTAVSLFQEQFLRSPSCAVIVNSVDRGIVANPQGIMSSLNGLSNISKISKRILLKKSRVGDDGSFLDELKETLLHEVQSVQPGKVGQLNMARTFDPEASTQIMAFFEDCMKRYMKQTSKERFSSIVEKITEDINIGRVQGPVSKAFRNNYDEIWKQFRDGFSSTQEYKLLYEICGEQYKEALKTFGISFQYDYSSALAHLKIKEKEEAVKAAQQKCEQLKEQQEAAETAAAEAQRKAELNQRKKEEAEELEKRARAQAEAALADATKNKEERDRAQQEALQAAEQLNKAKLDFDKVTLECKEKERLAQEESEKSKKAAEDAKKKADDLRKEYEERDRKMKETMDKMQQESQQFIKKIDELNKKQDEASHTFTVRQLELKLEHEQRMREMAERHASELAARSGDGGGCILL